MFASALLPQFVKARLARFLGLVQSLLLFIASVLLIFLNLACYNPSKAFSEIYVVKVIENSSRNIHAGYFRMCETQNLSNSTMTCSPIHDFKGSDLAYAFAKRVTRPYFVVMGTVLTLISLLACILHSIMRAKQAQIQPVVFGLTSVSLALTLVGACWQQVAVQAAVVLLSDEVVRGYRAAGLIWSTIAMQILAVCSQAWAVTHENENDQELAEKASMNSSDTGFSSNMYKVNLKA